MKVTAISQIMVDKRMSFYFIIFAHGYLFPSTRVHYVTLCLLTASPRQSYKHHVQHHDLNTVKLFMPDFHKSIQVKYYQGICTMNFIFYHNPGSASLYISIKSSGGLLIISQHSSQVLTEADSMNPSVINLIVSSSGKKY